MVEKIDIWHVFCWFISWPLTIYCDSSSAICFSQNHRNSSRTKHFDVKFLFVREKIINLWLMLNILDDPSTKTCPLEFWKYVTPEYLLYLWCLGLVGVWVVFLRDTLVYLAFITCVSLSDSMFLVVPNFLEIIQNWNFASIYNIVFPIGFDVLGLPFHFWIFSISDSCGSHSWWTYAYKSIDQRLNHKSISNSCYSYGSC